MEKSVSLPTRPHLKLKEVAAHFGVCTRTIRRWSDAGELVLEKYGGSSRITRESIEVREQMGRVLARGSK